jgi:hypothetical protein
MGWVETGTKVGNGKGGRVLALAPKHIASNCIVNVSAEGNTATTTVYVLAAATRQNMI